MQNEINIDCNASILQALKQMDKVHHKMLIVTKKDLFFSIVTIGDLQRSIIKNIPLQTSIENIIDYDCKIFAHESDSIDSIKEQMLQLRAEFMPVLNNNHELAKVYFWSDFFDSTRSISSKPLIDLPVVVMAGGQGTRLRPLTNVIPKPLIPIGNKTILEEILSRFEIIGCKKFFMSVNYKYDMIEYYLNSLDHKYEIQFFRESKPLGTIGSLSLMKGKISTPFIVSNCDNLLDQDIRDVYEYHCKNHNEITIVTAVKSYKIPYGVIETGDNGIMTGLSEKPELTYQINTGVYILEPELINEIPINQFYHITDLIDKVRSRGGNVGCFPISEKSWIDMGEWSEYLNLIKVI